MSPSSNGKDKPHLYLIDGSGYIFRAFFALPPMTRSDGTPVGAVYGFCQMLLRLLEDSDANYIGLIFDAKRLNFRQEIYPQYKANRPEAPPELVPQFPLFREAAAAFGLIPIEKEGYEADDLIAAYAKAAKAKGMYVTILSGDKDLMQVVSDSIDMRDPVKNKRIGREQVIEKFGVPPEKVIDVQALAGDASDNIPGVAGIGIKTAAQLINEYGDLESLLSRAGEIKQPKRRESLLQNRALAELSRQLVTLDDSAPLPYSLADLRRKDIDEAQAKAFFDAMEFKSLSARLQARARNVNANNKGNGRAPIGLSLSAAAEAYEVITTSDALSAWVADIKHHGVVAIDTETTSLSPLRAELVGISLALAGGRAAYIPLAHVQADEIDDNNDSDKPDSADLFTPSENGSSLSLAPSPTFSLCPNQLPLNEVLQQLKPLLRSPAILKIGQNIKYDIAVLANYDLKITPYDDTMLMSFVLSAGEGGHGMDELSEQHLGHKPIAYEDLTGKGKKQIPFAQIPIKIAARYAAEDADVTYRLWELFVPHLQIKKLWAFYQRIERPLPTIIADMERHGIKISPQKLQQLSAQFSQRLEQLQSRIYTFCQCEFNIASPKQLGEVLFEKLALSGGKKTKSGTWSTDSDTLEELATKQESGIISEIAKSVLEYRMLAKLIGTYTSALIEQVNPQTQRVHTHFMLTGAQTGRLSSTDPNLQNIPIRTPEGREIRKAFIAEDGSQLVSFDYSQIELRVVAEIANIPSLRQAFLQDQDIHAMTAAQVFGCELDAVSKELRRQAKAINFGIIYGISSFGLARQINCSKTEAKKFIELYFQRFPGIQDYMHETIAQCQANGYVQTLFGRRIHIRGIKDKNPVRRHYAERQAINAPIQGTAADIIKRAMLRIPTALQKADLHEVKMLLQVHDELIFEAANETIEGMTPLIRDIMQNAHLPARPLQVPLKVDVGKGDNWYQAH